MRSTRIVLLTIFAAGVAVLAQAESSTEEPRVTALVERYMTEFASYASCDEVGRPSQEYRDAFRERLRTTQDLELRRLMVLASLSAEVESLIGDFEKDVTGRGSRIPKRMTKDERIQSDARLREMLRDLTVLDPADSKDVIANLTARLNSAVGKRK